MPARRVPQCGVASPQANRDSNCPNRPRAPGQSIQSLRGSQLSARGNSTVAVRFYVAAKPRLLETRGLLPSEAPRRAPHATVVASGARRELGLRQHVLAGKRKNSETRQPAVPMRPGGKNEKTAPSLSANGGEVRRRPSPSCAWLASPPRSSARESESARARSAITQRSASSHRPSFAARPHVTCRSICYILRPFARCSANDAIHSRPFAASSRRSARPISSGSRPRCCPNSPRRPRRAHPNRRLCHQRHQRRVTPGIASRWCQDSSSTSMLPPATRHARWRAVLWRTFRVYSRTLRQTHHANRFQRRPPRQIPELSRARRRG